MFGAIFALTAQGLILYYVIQALETILIPWHISVRSGEEYGTM
jgi:ABC-type nitrate/sulfonate/bicarbonate transport system permease component